MISNVLQSGWLELPYDGPEGCRLDLYLRERFRPFSRTVWARQVAAGRVLVNGRKVSASRKMHGGDVLAIDPATAGPPPPPEGIRIVYEDPWIVAVCKDAGILIHPVRMMTRDTVVGWVRGRYPRARPCHRLDKLTSGLVMLALDAASARSAQAAFESGKVAKEYLALVEGSVSSDEGRIEAAIGPDPSSPVRIRMCVRADGERSVTDYRVLERFPAHTLLAVEPRTGRKHQIRVHLAYAGHPIHGDFLYGRELDVDYFENRAVNLARDRERWLGLHARSLCLEHPSRPGHTLRLNAEPPARFLELLRELRG